MPWNYTHTKTNQEVMPGFSSLFWPKLASKYVCFDYAKCNANISSSVRSFHCILHSTTYTPWMHLHNYCTNKITFR